MIKNKNLFYIKVSLIFLLAVVPFSLSDYTDNIVPEKITSDLRFYEINTCNTSLNEFLFHNPNVIYQDHYKIRFNNYSSVRCFGQITGIDQIGYNFYISIGTNSLINLILQSSIWLLLISIYKKTQNFKINFKSLCSIVIAVFLICLLIYSEKRYYSKLLFEMDLEILRTYIYIFSYFFYVVFFSYYIFTTRDNSIINLIPFAFIFMGLFSGFNIYFYFLFFLAYGVNKIVNEKKFRSKFNLINIVIIFWAYSALGNDFYLKPDKIRGLSSSVYNFLSVFTWSYIIIFSIFGIFIFMKENTNKFELLKLRNNFLISGSAIIILGYLGSSFPYLNFLNYYYFGQTKFGTDDQSIFSRDYWGENEAWRGFFPSAETIGEFYAIAIILFFLTSKFSIKENTIKENKLVLFGIILNFIGLLASNNKAAFVTLFLCLSLFKFKNRKLNFKYKLIGYSFVVTLFFYFVGFQNLLYDLSFSANKMIDLSYNYGLDYNRSSFVKYYFSTGQENIISRSVILFLGQVAFLINRSELWGLFFSRYNPTLIEFFMGTGPFILSDLYSDIDILSLRISTGTPLGFLLPHSSFLLSLTYFGLIGTTILIFYLFKKLKKLHKENYVIFLVCLFICINIIKSDSILFAPSLIMYLTFLSYSKNKKI